MNWLLFLPAPLADLAAREIQRMPINIWERKP